MKTFQRSDYQFDYPRYLEAKATVDERALHPVVQQEFLSRLKQKEGSTPLRVLEIGAGIGDQAERVLNYANAHDLALHYEIVEPDPNNLAAARSRLQSYSSATSFIEMDFLAFAQMHETENAKPYDAIIGKSVLDLLSIQSALKELKQLTNENSLYYFPLTFAMVTSLYSAKSRVENKVEDKIAGIYHQSICQKTGLEQSDSVGHIVLSWATENNWNVIARASDWLVVPQQSTYPEQEKYFVACILGFMHDEAIASPKIENSTADRWWNARMNDLHAGRLVYTANQFDILIQR